MGKMQQLLERELDILYTVGFREDTHAFKDSCPLLGCHKLQNLMQGFPEETRFLGGSWSHEICVKSLNS